MYKVYVQPDLTPDTMHDQQCAKATVRRLAQCNKTTQLKTKLPRHLQRAMELCSEKGASSWLSCLPIEEHGFALPKGDFRDALCMRYNWQPTQLPSTCVCGSTFSIDHALSCPTGGLYRPSDITSSGTSQQKLCLRYVIMCK